MKALLTLFRICSPLLIMKKYKPTGLSLYTNRNMQDGFSHPACIFILIIFISSLTLSFSAYSQKQNNIWCFGDSAGIDFNNLINPTPFSSSLDTRGSCVSIADTNGMFRIFSSSSCHSFYITRLRMLREWE